MAEIVITAENFEKEVLQSQVPVLLDFWATWCGPCRMIAPHVAQIAEEYEGVVKVGKVNVDEEPELATSFHIDSIPTLVVMSQGQVTATAVGYRDAGQIKTLLNL